MPTLDELIKEYSTLTGDAKQGAIDAITKILQSRRVGGGMGGGAGGLPPEIDMPVDPDLDDPSQKGKGDIDEDDLDINDPEDLLKNKQNKNDSNKDSKNDSDKNSEGDESQEKAEQESDANKSDKPAEGNPEQDGKSGDDSNLNVDQKWDSNKKSPEETELNNSQSKEADRQPGEPENSSDVDGNSTEEEPEIEYEQESEDNPLVDENSPDGITKDELQHRKIMTGRAKSLAKNTVDKASAQEGDSKIDENKIKNIQDKLDELEKLTDQDLAKMNKDELTKKVNNLLDAIDSVAKITYSSDLKTRIEKIKDQMDDPIANRELDAEDNENIRNDAATIKAREAEKAKYRHFGSIADFKINFYRAIKDQVENAEDEEDTYAAVNKHYEGEDIVKPGSRVDDLPIEDIPSVDVFFDQSGSWDEDDVKVGQTAISVIKEFDDKKEIILNIYYFANHVHNTAEMARVECGTNAWDEILDTIKGNKSKNVVLMTDTDMTLQARHSSGITIDGGVWFIWRNNKASEEIVNKLRGKLGSHQYSFNS